MSGFKFMDGNIDGFVFGFGEVMRGSILRVDEEFYS